MFNNHRVNKSEIMNLNNVIQYTYDINKILTRIKEYFLKNINEYFFKIMFDNITPHFINIYS